MFKTNPNNFFFLFSPRYTLMRALEIDDYLIVEGPSIIYRKPYYYLFFSGNGFYSPIYHVSVARSTSVTGPYERRDWAYFLHTDLVIPLHSLVGWWWWRLA